MKKDLFVIVDMQNDFVSGALGFEDADKVGLAIKKLLDTYPKDYECVYTLDTHHKETYLKSQEGKFLPMEHCIEGTWGYEIVDELNPKRYGNKVKTVIKKPTFGSKELLDFFIDHQDDYNKIIIMGLVTDICVVSAALMAKTGAPELAVYVVSDLTDSYDKEGYKSALKVMEQCQCQIITLSDLI